MPPKSLTRIRVSPTVLSNVQILTEGSVQQINEFGARCRDKLLAYAVTKDTNRLYASRIKLMQQILQSVNQIRVARDLQPLSWNKNLFFIFINALMELKIAGSTIEGYRSAIVDGQRHGSFPGEWAGEEDVIRAVKGARYQGGKQKTMRVRGQMDGELFEAFSDWLEEEIRGGAYDPSLLFFFRLLFDLALRISQLIRIKVEDVSNETIEVENKKGYRADSMVSTAARIQVVPSKEFIELLNEIKKRKKIGDFIFDRNSFDERTAREAVKRWADTHEFSFLDVDGIVFDGPHTVRHGALAKKQELIRDAILKAAEEVSTKLTVGCTSRNVTRYAIPNNKRVPKRSRSS